MSSQRLNTQLYHVCLVISLWKVSEAVFSFQCPVQSHWKHRSEAICDSFDKYFCLYDRNEKKYNESCRESPDVEAPGYKLIVAGSLQGDTCDHDFYQPFKFSSIGNNRCVYKQPNCSEEGQVVYRNGTEKIVRSCRCDYTRGYDFITRPNYPCLCVPSEEDCSCYHKICPIKYILSPDYECLNENEWKLSFQCDSIATVVLSKDSGISSFTGNSSFDYHAKAYGMSACVAVLVMLVVMLSVLVLLLELPVLQDCLNRTKRKRTDFETIPIQDFEETLASIMANEKSCLEKQIEANESEKKKLKDEISKLKDNIGNVPDHVLELQKETLQHWSNVLNKVVLTKAATFLYQHILTKNVIAIIGPTGTGKSAYAYHIAFRLKNEYDYTIVPARQPSDILQYCIPGTKQVFVIDDFIGKYAFDEAEGVSWEKMGPLLQKILRNNDQTKVILTCRKSIWVHKTYERFRFSAFVCDLHTKELRLTLSEKRQIFKSYIVRGDVEPLNDDIIMMYTFFPSLCSIFSSNHVGVDTSLFTMPVQFIEQEINSYEEKSQARYMSLAVLAIKQKITKQSFLNDIENEELIKNLYEESEFQIRPSKKLIISHLVALTDTYVKVDNNCFEFIHDTMQNIVLFCIAKTFPISVLTYCKGDVFKNQVRLACVHVEDTVPAIKIRSEHEDAYFTRLASELCEGQFQDVFENDQNAFRIFRKKWLVYLNKVRRKIPLKPNSDGSTVLHVVSSLGYADYVSYLIKIDTGMVDQADANGNTPLHLASLNGHINSVKHLVETSHNVHILNNDKVSPFFCACENNEIQVVKYLINLKGDLVKINETYTKKEHRSVLHIACLHGLTQIVGLLLDHHATVDTQDKYGMTPLHLTCLNGHYNTAALLLINNLTRVNINALDMLQRTPVYLACIGKYTEIVKLLIMYKANINQSTPTGHTPLHAACNKESIEIVNILIENFSFVNVKEKTVESPLHIACRNGNERIVKLLIDCGSAVNSKTYGNVTPLHEACTNGHQKVVDILLKNKANYRQKNIKGWTALLFSCAKGYNDIVKMILNLETDVNISNKDGVTPLMLACKGNHINVVDTLLVSNANVNQCDNNKCSSLEYACTSGNPNIVSVLLKHGANINLSNKNGITPLHRACMNDHKEVVKGLIENKADINSKDFLGGTPLHKACVNGDIEIVKILLNTGAKINITDTSGKLPVAIAKENEFSRIVELLDNANTVLG